MVTYWATSSGSHFFNSTIDSKGEHIRFDVSTGTVRLKTFAREPAKVIRTTYAKQTNTVASLTTQNNIPRGFMQSFNYKYVTAEYWPVKDIYGKLFNTKYKQPIVYACVFNYLQWHPTWWGKRDTVLLQAKKYHLKQLAVLDKFFHIDRKLAANETRKLEKEMPEALKLLSANDIDNNYKSQFGFALKYQKELQLNQQQVLQLLDKAKDYESKMQFARKHPDSGYFDSHKFESINMTSILTLSKYEQLLAYKNKDKAVEQAGYTWYELTKKGLSSGLNKDSTIGTISQYYTLTYSIIDMYAHDIDARKRALKAIDAQMPAALVLIKKSKSNGNAGQYVW